MRTWTKSACVVLAWGILSIIPVAAAWKGSVHPAQANTRTAGHTEVILTSTLSVAAAPMTATSTTTRYVVQPGDTLSGIAARFAVRGGWPALYAANRQAIGRDPSVIHSGTVLVLPGQMAHVRYTVAAGDTLSGIAAEFAVRGGSPPFTRPTGGPSVPIRTQSIPGPCSRSRARRTVTAHAGPGPQAATRPAPPPSPPAGPRHHPLQLPNRAPAATGMPRWLKIMLLSVGLLILVVFLAEPVLAVRRRRQRAAVQGLQFGKAGPGQGPGSWQPGADNARIVLADHDRLVVTRNTCDDTVYVLRPPGEDPKAILRVARLVLRRVATGSWPSSSGCPPAGRWSRGARGGGPRAEIGPTKPSGRPCQGAPRESGHGGLGRC